MPAILRGPGQVLREYKPQPQPISSYVPKWPEAKGKPYAPSLEARGVVPPPEPQPLPSPPTGFLPSERIVAAVAKAFDVPADKLMSHCRKRVYAWPRFALYRLLSECMKWSTVRIGAVCKRDHTTVMNGLARIKVLLAADPEFAAAYARAVDFLSTASRREA